MTVAELIAKLKADGLAIVPALPTEAMQAAFDDQHPYILRQHWKYDDGRQWEVVRRDHPEWRDVVAEPMTVLERYATVTEAEPHFDRLVFAWRYAAMIAVVDPVSE